MYAMSPVAHVDKVQAPTMVMLGMVDRRVPPSQGIEFHKALKARGVPTRYLRSSSISSIFILTIELKYQVQV